MSPTQIATTLRQLGAAPRKSFGQNFLHDTNLARWIVDRLALSPGDHVVEIGPGLGALTNIFVAAGVSATLLEKDRIFANFLRERMAGFPVEVIEIDALEYEIGNLFGRGAVKLVGNLPYYLATALITKFLEDPCPFSGAILTLQKEVAERLTAAPGSKDYGALTILTQWRWRVTRLKNLSPSVFFPRPQVDSSIVEFRPRERADLPLVDPGRFRRLVRLGFSQRRKQLRNNLGLEIPASEVDRVMRESGLPAACRAEDLRLEHWIDLANQFWPILIHGEEECLAVVDENDRPVAEAKRAEVHANSSLHRSVHIFVFNSRGQILLQKRSSRKDRAPLKWDSSAAGHVNAKESYQQCGERELVEELGLALTLTWVCAIPALPSTGYEFVQLFSAVTDQEVIGNPYEIEAVRFFDHSTVQRWIAAYPEDFAPGFLECYRCWQKHRSTPEILPGAGNERLIKL